MEHVDFFFLKSQKNEYLFDLSNIDYWMGWQIKVQMINHKHQIHKESAKSLVQTRILFGSFSACSNSNYESSLVEIWTENSVKQHTKPQNRSFVCLCYPLNE